MIRLLALLAAVVAAGSGTPVSVIHDSRITESSGLAASHAHPGLAYTVNDSGSGPVVYTVEIASGAVVGTTRLTGVDFHDTEALGLDGDGTVWVADIGDNEASRPRVELYAYPEQGPGSHTVRPSAYVLTYPDGPHEAETLLIDRGTGHKRIVTKSLSGGRVYDVPDRLSTDGSNRLGAGAALPGLYTDGDVSADGRLALLLTYASVEAYRLPGWTYLTSIPTSGLAQSETLILEPDGRTFLVGSEGADSPLLRFRTPALPGPTPAATSRAPVQSSPTPPASDRSNGHAAPVAVILVVLAGLVVFTWRRRR